MKDLITTQLIEGYQKELDAVEIEIDASPFAWIEDMLIKEQSMLIKLIARLESKQEEEMQNVKDAHTAGQFNAGVDSSPYEALVYFNQTFNQPTK